MSSLSINNISQYASVSDLLSTDNIQELKKNQKDLQTLFSGNFATMGFGSEQAETIYAEIKELEALIKREEKNIQTWQKIVQSGENEIRDNKYLMDCEITQFVIKNENAQNDAQQRISAVTAEVIDEFARGGMDQSDVAKEIQRRVGNIDALTYNLDTSKIDSLAVKIEALTNKVTDAVLKRNIASTKINTANSSIQLLNEMYQMQIESLGETVVRKGPVSRSGNQAPVFTPTQQAYVDELFAKYHTSAGGDRCSAGNPQVVKLAEALGVKDKDGNYTLTPKGEEGENKRYENSILQEMYDKGFDFVQAMYALDYIMGMDSYAFNYDATSNNMTVAYGHGAEAQTTFASLVNQAQTIWSVQNVTRPTEPDPVDPDPVDPDPVDPDPVDPDPVDPDPVDPDPVDPDPVDPDPVDPDPVDPDPDPTTPSTVVRTDPIGWAEDDTTFDFIIDRNGDNKFNAVQDAGESDASEFLGALDGIKELTKYDANNDGVIAGDEITNMSNDGIKILKTDHKNSGYGFMTLKDAGIESIDLKSMKKQNHTTVNGNNIQNTFGITLTNNRNVTAYQSLDDNNYLNAVYGNAEGYNIASKIDFSNNSNKNAFDMLASERCYFLAEDEVKEIKAEVEDILDEVDAKADKSQRKIDANQRDLKADEKAAIVQAERETEDIAEERAAEEAEAQAKAEAERTAEEQALLDALRNEQIAALSRQLTVIDTQLADLYNKGSIDEALTSSRASIAAQLEDLGVTVAEPNWDEYMDKLNEPEEV